jgi:hypothetical protein
LLLFYLYISGFQLTQQAEMSEFNNYIPEVTLQDVQNWGESVTHNVNLELLGFEETPQRNQLGALLRNAHEVTAATMQNYVDKHVHQMADWMNENMGTAYTSIVHLQQQVNALEKLVDTQKQLLQSYKAQLDRIPADAGSGPKSSKIPDPPTFSGSDNKMNLDDWLNQVALYCTHNGIATDHQKIVTALARLRSPATTYMRVYYDNVRLGIDLGSWDHFVGELSQIYGKRDDKEGAKDEITSLWANKTLANKDFIKYAEQYRTLARIVDYQDNLHIDKLRDVIPQELRNSLVMYEVSDTMPKYWEAYLELLLKAYKALHPEKSKSAIFGNGNGSGNGKKNPDPNAMEIDEAKKSKGKAPAQANSQEAKKKYCQICAGKGYKAKASSHNTVDCWEKPGNEGKKPSFKNSSSNNPSSSGQGNKGGQNVQGGKKSFKTRLMELLEEEDEDGSAPPAGSANINSASIQEVVDSEPAETEAPVQVNEAQSEPKRPTGQRTMVNRRTNLDFPKGL